MKRSITYEQYLDKVCGCFLGKTVLGTVGAPYEGVKMPLDEKLRPEMFDAMIPNDDLDLQILWLDAVEMYGPDFTSEQLLDRFVNYCDYSPGEYAVMRKNFSKRIMPPYSGSFCNDFYREGMGCPIRSEIWACLAAGNMDLAAEFSSRDGILDHSGESVQAERFFAAFEAEAFFCSDVWEITERASAVIEPDSRFKSLLCQTVELCKRYGDIKKVFSKIMFAWGHPDCTNMYQNMAITMAALLLGDLNPEKTAILALNCGFDTDCTLASAGAALGIIVGAEALKAGLGIGDIKYTLGVKSKRRSDSVLDLAEDIAMLGLNFTQSINGKLDIVSLPKDLKIPEFNFIKNTSPLLLKVDYENKMPSIGFGEDRDVYITAENLSGDELDFDLSYDVPAPLIFKEKPIEKIKIKPFSRVIFTLSFTVPCDAESLNEKNIITVKALGKTETELKFGISGASAWSVTGPIWLTDPVCSSELLRGKPNYWALLADSKTTGNDVDKVRQFHLNFYPDTETEFLGENELFAPYAEDKGNYETRLRNIHEDSFCINDFFGFHGPCIVYMARQITAPEDMNVCVQLGHTSPYSLYLNGEIVSRRDYCDTWTSENVHVSKIPLKKGINNLVFRITRVNSDAKYNLIFSKGETCAEHYTCFGSINPRFFK